MSADFDPPPWGFIVDTTEYSGNFERELCAWITGQIGECSVGEEHAEAAREELKPADLEWFEDNVQQVPDDHGCHRPTSIWPTPRYFNDGMGSHWKEGSDPDAVREKYQETSREYVEDSIVRCKRGIVGGEQVEDWERELAVHEKKLAELEKEKPGRFPAYQSVIVFLSTKPPQNIIDLMMERARSYRPEFHRLASHMPASSHFEILGFRLIRMELKETVEWESQ